MNTKQVLSELRRELSLREDYYPMWIRSGRITSAVAEHRIAAIKQAIELIEVSQQPKPTQFSIFGGTNHEPST